MKPKQMDLVISRSLIGAHCWASGRVFEASSEMKSKRNAKLEKQTVSLKVLEKLPWEPGKREHTVDPGPRRGCF